MILHFRENTMRKLVALALLASLLSPAAWADRVYQYRDKQGHVLFTDKDVMPQEYKLVSVRQYGWTFDARPLSAAERDRYDSDIKLAARRHAVSPALIKAVMHAESHFDRYAVSRAGAQGLMQLMPATAASLNINDTFNVRQNIQGGAALLAWLSARFSTLDEVLAGYNAGAGNVVRYGGIPPFDETVRYVAKVKELLPRYQKQFGGQGEELARR